MQLKGIAVTALSQAFALPASEATGLKKRVRSVFGSGNPRAKLRHALLREESQGLGVTTGEENPIEEATNFDNVSSNSTREEARDECDPGSQDPDIGIFSCGPYHQCVNNKESSRGGFCKTYKKIEKAVDRALQMSDPGFSVCDGATEGPVASGGFTCDCSNFSNGTGTYSCTGPGGCIDNADSVCYTLQYDGTITSNVYSYTYCFNFDESSQFPVENFCYTVAYEGLTDVKCGVAVNHVDCNSCTSTTCSDGQEGAEIDCLNTDVVVGANTCGDDNFIEGLFLQLLPAESTPTDPPVQMRQPLPTMASDGGAPMQAPTIVLEEGTAPPSAATGLAAKTTAVVVSTMTAACLAWSLM